MIKFLIILTTFFCISFADNIRPANGASLTYIYVPFEWEQEPNAISYNLQIVRNDAIILDIVEESTV